MGGVWFTAIFGRACSATLGRDHDPSAKPPLLTIAGPVVWSFVTAIVMALLMVALGVDRVGGAFGFGLFIGCGLLVLCPLETGPFEAGVFG